MNVPWFYLPLPASFLQGFDLTLSHERTMMWNTVMFNQYHSHGLWYYFPVLFLLKTPIGVLILSAIGLTFFLPKAMRSLALRQPFASSFIFVLAVQWVLFFVYFNFIFRTHVGIRYIVMATAMFYVFVGLSYGKALWKPKHLIWVTGLLLLGFFEQLPYWNNSLSFTNSLIMDKKMAYFAVTDSNIAWGQNYDYARALAHKKYPEAHIDPDEIKPGINIIKLNDFAGVHRNFEKHRWLREHLRPTEHIEHTYLVFFVSNDDYIKFKDSNPPK
jgi:hypothetical protein